MAREDPRRLRVIHTITTGRDVLTGVYRSVRELAVAQSAVGLDVHIVAEGSWPPDGIRALGVHVHEGGRRESLRRVHALAGPDSVIHTHTLWRSIALAPALVRRSRRGACVISPHNALSQTAMGFKPARKRAAWWLLFGRAVAAHHMIIATTDREQAETGRYARGVPIAVLPNAATPPDPTILAEVVRTDAVGCLGRIHPIKGIRELALAWAAVAPGATGWRLRIAGPVEDDAYWGELRRIAQSCPSIELCGPLYGQEKWRFLASCKIIAIPSKTEGFANVLAESLLAQTPVLASYGVPCPKIEQLGMGWRGAGSVEGLSAMLKEALAAGDAARTRMGWTGEQFIRRSYNPAAIAVQSQRIYEAAARHAQARRDRGAAQLPMYGK